eukprot:738616_1
MNLTLVKIKKDRKCDIFIQRNGKDHCLICDFTFQRKCKWSNHKYTQKHRTARKTLLNQYNDDDDSKVPSPNRIKYAVSSTHHTTNKSTVLTLSQIKKDQKCDIFTQNGGKDHCLICDKTFKVHMVWSHHKDTYTHQNARKKLLNQSGAKHIHDDDDCKTPPLKQLKEGMKFRKDRSGKDWYKGKKGVYFLKDNKKSKEKPEPHRVQNTELNHWKKEYPGWFVGTEVKCKTRSLTGTGGDCIAEGRVTSRKDTENANKKRWPIAIKAVLKDSDGKIIIKIEVENPLPCRMKRSGKYSRGDAGHLVGRQLGGGTEEDNMVPQNPTVNEQGGYNWRGFENDVRRKIQSARKGKEYEYIVTPANLWQIESTIGCVQLELLSFKGRKAGIKG